MSDIVTETDRRFLAAAIRLGAGANGETWPNPAVGAIVVKDGRVVGRGRTASGGRPHAETIALREAGERAAGGTLYVSLEPCAHHGRTPPCADAVIAAGIARVVACASDPDPRVSGRGFARMRDAGISVSADVLRAAAERAHAGHISRTTRNRPHVVLKLAVSADDAIGRAGETRVAVTGEIARRHVHALRARVDAILVGSGTVTADDPELTCRLPGLEHRSPVRIVLDTDGRLGRDWTVFAAKSRVPSWRIVAGPDGSATGEASEEGLLRTLHVRRGEGGVDLSDALRRLAEAGIGRLMVEGGAAVARSFLLGDLVDEVLLFRSPVALGDGAVPALAGLPLSAVESSPAFVRKERRMFGPDRLTRYERRR
ncbi:bifunctional diaminohydroxyphosphoribosylaminopyrimidine deaminase/5-amino-6-(5-phosphoribosylamino)uracil reductase RibD [Propylenella binzhouense]|uniref:Riboflavin biosynthesis protein RibD n=1 Tax=Propylenella binzhouense TaxID=2555902 RepID=A0A964T1H1_9HYPH|nr:bifunctional diaminohydroxyphosphoribosylaminopyrimidine deaminase/5-amino-6-(5-phosphoribosylamino)uracil reductase RibD [Propylenella binzhouense]MYZ46703.1 bifunctional diaminohydroxyphosphoribosylaminopyrimidine deaminase/5-amino-6-(5-phosphoribosylamino)uracil reductase RibD [Propylenella binzhouense]